MWAKVGDIYEVEVGRRFAYFQVSHIHEEYGPLIRCFDSLFKRRPDSPDVVLRLPIRFSAFLPVNGSIKRKEITKFANALVCAKYRQFPVFRFPNIMRRDSRTGRFTHWFFWDGKKEWLHGSLTARERRMPIRGIWGFELLRARLLNGWTAERCAW